jgi:hypothetical protein
VWFAVYVTPIGVHFMTNIIVDSWLQRNQDAWNQRVLHMWQGNSVQDLYHYSLNSCKEIEIWIVSVQNELEMLRLKSVKSVSSRRTRSFSVVVRLNLRLSVCVWGCFWPLNGLLSSHCYSLLLQSARLFLHEDLGISLLFSSAANPSCRAF